MDSPVNIASFVEPNFGENAYVLWVNEGGPCWIVDPGLPPSARDVIAHIEEHGLKPDAVLITHGHADHIAGVPEVLQAFEGLAAYIGDGDKPALTDPRENLSVNLGASFTVECADTRDLAPNTELTLDGTTWKVLDTAGHSPGGRSFYCAAAGVVFVGDTLFQLSIGRTDFHHSNHDQLIRNIHENLFTLPDETKVYCGHGPATTIGDEKQYNPFLQD